MNYCTIKNCDIANGLGVRVSLFVSGCRNHCQGCFQPETWDFNYGDEFTEDVMNKLLDMINKSYITGFSILGGEPLEPENQDTIYHIIKTIKRLYPNKNIWIYTGFKYEELYNSSCRAHTDIIKSILKEIDILVDGKFIEDLKDITLKFRGSSNQRIIDIKRTLMENKVILYNV